MDPNTGHSEMWRVAGQHCNCKRFICQLLPPADYQTLTPVDHVVIVYKNYAQ